MNKKLPYISVIITTRDHPELLWLVLMSLAQQTVMDFEVIIADDGSSEVTQKHVTLMCAHFAFPLFHVWQPYAGFRAATIRNKAVTLARGEYLVFLDGDCVVTPTFIQRQQQLAESGMFVSGNRVLLSKKFTLKILTEHLLVQRWSFAKWIKVRLLGDCNRILPFISLPLFGLRKLRKHRWQGVKSCNLAIWKHDFFAVNGFDEEYRGWGYEDSDLVIRLLRSGIYRKDANFGIPVMHFWHPRNDRAQESANYQRLQAVLNSNSTVATRGVKQYGK